MHDFLRELPPVFLLGLAGAIGLLVLAGMYGAASLIIRWWTR